MDGSHDESRQPWWTVTAVFDPDGGGADFGYTVGLAGAGVPELHLWARPSHGEDPGFDWKFSQRDTCGLLNEIAWRLLDGRLAVGDTWTESYDEGLVEAQFTVGEPVPAEDVDAFAAGDVPVLPITWELRRPPVGPPRPLTAAEQAEAAAAYDRLVSGRGLVTAPGWELPRTPSWDPEERFGPRTPLVLARAAQLASASADDWVTIGECVVVGYDVVPVGYALSVARTVARAAGRVTAVDEVESAVEGLMAGFGTGWGVEQRAAVREWFEEGLPAGPDLERGWRRVLEGITHAITGHLVAEAVADVLPSRVTLLGQGTVLAALAPPGAAPDARWLCSPPVDRAVTDLVKRTPLAALVEAAARWDPVVFHPGPGQRILLVSWTSPGCSRSVLELLDPVACVVAGEALRSRGLGLGSLQVWLTSLATVLTERAAFEPAAVEAFLTASGGIPGLAKLVNTPLTTEAA